MKNLIFTLLGFVFLNSASAQSFYSQPTVTGDGITYICDHSRSYLIKIYNSDNQFENIKMTYKDGTNIFDDPENFNQSSDDLVRVVNSLVETSILKQGFGIELFEKLKQERELLLLFYTIDLDGNVIEVSFEFEDDSAFIEVSPEVFYGIEQQLKSRLKYNVLPKANDYNIIKIVTPVRFWAITI